MLPWILWDRKMRVRSPPTPSLKQCYIVLLRSVTQKPGSNLLPVGHQYSHHVTSKAEITQNSEFTSCAAAFASLQVIPWTLKYMLKSQNIFHAMACDMTPFGLTTGHGFVMLSVECRGLRSLTFSLRTHVRKTWSDLSETQASTSIKERSMGHADLRSAKRGKTGPPWATNQKIIPKRHG